jgi:hypothetical protein
VAAASYDLATTDHILSVTYTATGSVAIDLKTAQTISGRLLTIKDSGGLAGTNNITITTEGGEKIDGQDTLILNSNYQSVDLFCDGSHWFVF